MRRRIDNVWDTHQEATAMHGGTWIGCGMIAGALFPAAMIWSHSWSAVAPTLTCNMAEYKETAGLTAVIERDVLVITWNGQSGSEVRAKYVIDAVLSRFSADLITRSRGACVVVQQSA